MDADLELPESASMVDTPTETQFLAALGVVRYFDISCFIIYIYIYILYISIHQASKGKQGSTVVKLITLVNSPCLFTIHVQI